jgi:bifunctional UDP-N-acetylglucosamine pyrophosphorylase/glucosamine-1-phosphate N-acetyltransferase
MATNRPALAALILAAGKGTRMKSARPKVLHEVCGRPLFAYPLEAARSVAPERLLTVVGHGADAVRERFAEQVEFVLQAEQRGTGHAVQQCAPALEGFRGDVVVLYGDTPLLRGETLERMSAHKPASGADLVLLSAEVEVPGIVIRDEAGAVVRIVEAPDAQSDELRIAERNTGVYLLDADLLWKLLAQVDDDNAQGEVYLTDIVEVAVGEGRRVEALKLEEPAEALGVNTRRELAEATRHMRERILNRLMEGGVTIVDPGTTFVDADVVIGGDSVIEPGCVISGPTRIGEGVRLRPHCTIESSEIGDRVTLGPSAHVRPDCRIGEGSRIGKFVEVKNSVLGAGVKADHLGYIGDADVGDGASFGCGSIVVNYDGISKHRSQVGVRAFVDCNVNLVAPVCVRKNASIAAGSTITQDVPEGALAVARERKQHVVEDWSRRKRPAEKLR